MAPSFEQIVDHVRPEIVHAGPIQSCAFIAALCDFSPLMAMSWGSDLLVDAERDELWSWVTGYTLRHSDVVVCDSDIVRAAILRLDPAKNDKIVQFPWGVDLTAFSSGPDRRMLRERAGWDDAIVVVSTRSWEAIHQIDVLLEAFKRAVLKEKRLRLLLLGTGSLAHEVQRTLQAEPLRAVVNVAGVVSQDDMSDYFRASDIYISCTKSDGTSISLLEAMATGPVPIVTDGPGNREWIRNGVNGWLAKRGDAEAFARSVLEAAKMTRRERDDLARSNRQIVEARADWNHGVTKLLDAYQRLVLRQAEPVSRS